MMETKQALILLGLDGNATLEQAKIMYRTRVKQSHPDRFDHDPVLRRAAEAAMKEINQAYTVLCRVLPKTAGQEQGRAGSAEAGGLESPGNGSGTSAPPAKASMARTWWARLFHGNNIAKKPKKQSPRPVRQPGNPTARPVRQPPRAKPCFEETFQEARTGHRQGETRFRDRAPAQARGKPVARKGCCRDYRDYLAMKQRLAPRTRNRDASPGPIQAVRPVSRITGVGGGR